MQNTVTETNFLNKLRESTAIAHAALEALPVSESILKEDVSNEEYAHYLALMYDVVKDSEENIFPALQLYIPDITERKKTHLIEADLKKMGIDVTENQKPVSAGLGNPSAAYAMGILYVIEGSTLGGRVILKNISRALGYTEDSGAAYFSGYGNFTGSRWKSFLAGLSGFEAETGAGSEIIAGANYAFGAIHRHLVNNGNDK